MQMRDTTTGTVINVVQHVILRNFWEYYITEKGDQPFALVVGDFTEMGYIDREEIRPYIMSVCNSGLSDIMSAPGWEWVSKENLT